MKAIRIGFLATVGLLLTALVVSAGSTLDYGTLQGPPGAGEANYVAWLGSLTTTTPGEILTEDGYNPGLGVNGGYDGSYWRLAVRNFATPTASHGDQVSMRFGGLGTYSGYEGSISFSWNQTGESYTDHGKVPFTNTSNPCPTMLQGSLNGNTKTIRWSDPNGAAGKRYLIYRSTQASGAGNGASNGRYLYVATYTATDSGPYTYDDTGAGTMSWHVVIPADDSSVINGCHSAESDPGGNPTAVTLSAFRAASASAGWLHWAALGLLAAAAFALTLQCRRMRTGR